MNNRDEPKSDSSETKVTVKVFDFFSGCGGTSAGLQAAGMRIALGIDSDRDAAATFQANFPDAHVICKDIQQITLSDVRPYVDACSSDFTLFCGCAPCQPFSAQNGSTKRVDARRHLLDQFARFVKAFQPTFVFCENVPGLQRFSKQRGPFSRFCRLLQSLNYSIDHAVVDSKDFGVPQRRRRLILVASRIGKIKIPMPTHGPGTSRNWSTVWDWIAELPPLKAGQTDQKDPVHRAADLSALNLRRIKAIPQGGSRLDWPAELVLKCHDPRLAAPGHTDVYGRLRKDQPASAMTTRCISLSNGRFGHPTQHRAISAREAACLQTFPRQFKFHGNLNSMARQIGNAVPVLMAKHYGEHFLSQAQDGEVS